MAMIGETNFYIAVVVAAIVSFVIGGIWYSRSVFGKAWMAALGRTQADMEAMRKQAPKGFAAGLIGALISSAVLAIFVAYARAAGVGLPAGAVGGLVGGFLVWFGFLMTTSVAGAIFEGRSSKLLGINLGFSLVAYLVMGLIIGVWV